MTLHQLDAIALHGRRLLAIFPNATERDPVRLCKKLRRIEAEAHKIGERLCNDPGYSTEQADRDAEPIAKRLAVLLGNRPEYQPKTGQKCGCKRGIARDNCPACEGTGEVIDFRAIRQRPAPVPIILNRDPRGYALKIDSETMREKGYTLTTDWGGNGLIAPEIGPNG